MSEFTEAVEKLTTYGSDMFIGRLVWYAIPEDLVASHTEYHTKIIENFYDCETQPVLPGFPRPTDVFKRACTAAEMKNVPGPVVEVDGVENRTVYNYMVRPSGHDADNVWRTIVRETLDASGHTLNYDELVRITFNRKSEKLRFNNVDDNTDTDDPNVNEIVTAIIDYIKVEGDRITPYAVRESVRRFMERELGAIKVRPSGGVYFVNEKHAAEVEALDKTINSFEGSAAFHFLPLLDDSKQREMLRAAFEAESVGAIDSLIGEMVEITKKSDKKITSNQFAAFKVEYDRLRTKIVDYSDLLDEKMELSATRLEVMQQVLVELMTHVEFK